MTAITAKLTTTIHSFDKRGFSIIISLWLISVFALFLAVSSGIYNLTLSDILAWLSFKVGLGSVDNHQLAFTVLESLRLPRAINAYLIGGGLAIAGATLQGLFRNPLVAPSLIGVASGASLFAVFAIVLNSYLPAFITVIFKSYLISFFAFTGALVVTWIVFVFSKKNGKSDIALLLLSGVAFNALCGALLGLIIFFADESELRSFTFWSMGDLGAASLNHIWVAFGLILIPSLTLILFHRDFDAFALGEEAAYHMGTEVQFVKKLAIGCTALIVGTAVSIAGIISFVGLIVPHLCRKLFGAKHQILLPASFFMGATLLLLADTLSRHLVQPAVLSIGIVTSLLGAPFFLFLLFQFKKQLKG